MNPALTAADLTDLRRFQSQSDPEKVEESDFKILIDRQEYRFSYELPIRIKYKGETYKIMKIYPSLDVVVGSGTYWASMFKGIHSFKPFGEPFGREISWDQPIEHMSMILYKGAQYG